MLVTSLKIVVTLVFAAWLFVVIALILVDRL